MFVFFFSAAEGLSAEQTYIPPLLAVGATHHALIDAGLRMKVSQHFLGGRIISYLCMRALVAQQATCTALMKPLPMYKFTRRVYGHTHVPPPVHPLIPRAPCVMRNTSVTSDRVHRCCADKCTYVVPYSTYGMVWFVKKLCMIYVKRGYRPHDRRRGVLRTFLKDTSTYSLSCKFEVCKCV